MLYSQPEEEFGKVYQLLQDHVAGSSEQREKDKPSLRGNRDGAWTVLTYLAGLIEKETMLRNLGIVED